MGKRNEIGTTLTDGSLKLMFLGTGELGQEQIIEAQRLGIETIAVDRYENSPGMRVADRHYAINMLDAEKLREIVEKEKPDALIPEIEAINLDLLSELEKEGFFVVPNAKATHAAMHRKRIRELIAKEAGVKTSPYMNARTDDPASVKDACEKVGYPCVVKAIQSSSGLGSTDVNGPEEVQKAVDLAVKEARGSSEEVIVEGFIDFDTEVTELATRHYDEDGKIVTTFPKPVGHYQIEGDYHSSWQGPDVSQYLPWKSEDGKVDEDLALKAELKIYEATKKITDALGGVGLFGCELFVKEQDGHVQVYGNEISPRPHDTGLITIATHPVTLSEFGLHIRAVSGLPIPAETVNGYRVLEPIASGASHVLLSPYEGKDTSFKGIWDCMSEKGVILKLFGKPEAHVNRRMGVVLATADTILEAKKNAEVSAHKIKIKTKGNDWAEQADKRMHLALA